ncbi:unnamed protein product [Scytosiphon promiscuus]
MAVPAVCRQQLPVKAVIEGPAACFRLLDIDSDLGMRHDQFVGLLMVATDNRRDIQEAWVRHADIQQVSHEVATDVQQDVPQNLTSRMLLSPFLQAFADLSTAKYCGDQFEGDTRGSTNRLLLRDVFDNITNPTQTLDARYGMCAHLLRKDVCNFLLSQRPFTTRLFCIYAGEAPTSPRLSGRVRAAEGFTWAPLSAQDSKQGMSIISGSACMFWPGILAVASDLQLLPRLIGLDALKAAMEQVSRAPHREKGTPLGGSPLEQGAEPKRAATAGMSYPQFVEVLSLLSASAAGRLRPLYPDVAGPEPLAAAQSFCNIVDLSDCSEDKTTGLGTSFNLEKESAGADRGIDLGDENGTSKNAGKHSRKKAMHVRAASRFKNARCPQSALGAKGNLPTPAGDEEVQQALPSYDLGAMKAFFHHARLALEEGPTEPADRLRSNTSRPDVGPLGRNNTGEGTRTATTLRDCTLGGRSRSRGSVGIEDGATSRYEREEDEASNSLRNGATSETITYSTRRLQGLFPPLQSVSTVENVLRRVSDLESEILPCTTHQCETLMAADVGGSCYSLRGDKRVLLELKPVDGSVAPGAGGAFARLVVIKELQPVPKHIPDNARHLFELAMDHLQAGRYPLAMETLERGIAKWEELSGTEQVDNEPMTLVGRLDAPDEALALSMKASIHQCAGNDDEALSLLLRADEAVESINEYDEFLRQACLASVLSEMGVTLYYSGRTDLSLRCFKMALFIRFKLLQRSQRRGLGPDTHELTENMDGTLKRGGNYGTNEFDAAATEAAETATALTLNNFAVCLAATGETGRAVQALTTSSTITTSALGVEHPRSGVVSRNLALVKAMKGGHGRSTPATTAEGERRVCCWEKDVWYSLDTRQWASHYRVGEREDLLLYNRVAQRTSHVIPGGFLFAGILPNAVDGSKNVRSKGSTLKKGVKKRGKSGRRGR